MADNKAIHSLKVLGSDKEVYKQWNDKFINAICAVMGTGWRKYMLALNEKLDSEQK